MMKNAVIAATLAFTFAAPAKAELIQQFEPWSVPNQTSGFSLLAFQPFDTSLGTLDRVTLNLFGNVLMNSVATPNLVPSPPFGAPQPIPFNYQVGMNMDFFSLAGFDVDFSSDARFLFSGFDSGVGGTLVQSRTFSLTARFDELSELVGFTTPSFSNIDTPPISVIGTPGEFEENPLTASIGLQFQMLNAWSVIFENGELAIITPQGSSSGLVTLSYEYTPPELPPVPVPAALWLFATALAGFIGFDKRRKPS